MADASPPVTRAPDASREAATGPAEAPEHDEGESRRLHPLTIVQQVLTSLPAVAVLLIPFLTTGADAEAWGSLIPLVGYGVIKLPLIALRYLRFHYWVAPSQLVIRSGVVKTQHRSIPIEHVQNVQVIRSLLPRLLGMAKVKVETAGSGSTEGTLEYVSTGEAERIRTVVRAYQRRRAPARPQPEATEGAAATDAGSARTLSEETLQEETLQEETLYEMSLRRVLLAGAFHFSLALLALVFTALQWSGFDDPDRLARLFRDGPFHPLATTVLASPYLAVLFAVTVVCLLGWLTGIALSVNRYYGFRLWREGRAGGEAKLHYRRGLFTLSEGTIPLSKVQAVILRTNPLMRLFDWFVLEVQAMGVEGSNYRTVVPLARRREVIALARRIHPLELPAAFSRVSKLTVRRTTFRLTLALAALVGAAGFAGGLFVEHLFWHGAYWGLLLWPLAPAYATARYRCLGYALTGEGLLVQRGVLRQRVWLLPVEKQQVFYTTASYFQRRLGLKSLYLDTAGASGLASPRVVDLPAAEADRSLRRLYACFQQRFAAPSKRAPAGAPAGAHP